MRIGLISDTHIPSVPGEIPPQVKEIFQGVDLIFHAGDIYLVWVCCIEKEGKLDARPSLSNISFKQSC